MCQSYNREPKGKDKQKHRREVGNVVAEHVGHGQEERAAGIQEEVAIKAFIHSMKERLL